ncbi:hypothetical protein BCR32DRAFT_267478 [Anaeromyces robustus]|jgi:hypothetical protein|uniref:Coth-domain-containing protein n=1 Tax=Anaeromyces robustus TaxID=1754192 RepID=A0A1Y1XAC3_9FUNG|nr:hypothetical protein BCR32DRAFT_267478 [Anaeromyces robustus]|eukprot:ORX82693.1 hypothetical protein BCR32DRAFT_267478 [Anaeromyces robustus]
MLKITLLFALFISFVFADVADYVKSADRSFNPLEGKVPKMYIDMEPEELEKLKKIAQIDQENDIIIGCNLDASCLEDFETKVTMTFEVDGEKQVFKKVNFKTGGNYGRAHDRIGFNLKLKGDDLLYDRKQIRVRADAQDFSHIRSKIVYDLVNNWGLPSMQETYIEFYINDEYYGLYYLQDALKSSWIKKHYNIPEDKEVETLFNCRKDGVNLAIGDICEQTNEKVANYTQPFEEFLEKIDKAKTVEDLEKFMNVDLLMKNLAMEFLFGSFDHYIIQGHNFFVYQREDGIWDMILVDFDSELGSGLFVFTKFVLQYDIEDFGYRIKFEDMPKPGKKLLESAYFNDNTEFKKALRELMVTGFNPDALYRRIDELKEFIAPYVKKSITPREDGRLPGVINFKGTDNTHTYHDFEVGSEFEPINPMVPGVKGWIKNRFEFACEEYGFDPEEILMEAAAFRGEEYIPKTTEIVDDEEETEAPVADNEETKAPIADNEETEAPIADNEEETEAPVVDEEKTYVTIIHTTTVVYSEDEETQLPEISEETENVEDPVVDNGEESGNNAEEITEDIQNEEDSGDDNETTEIPTNGEEEQEQEPEQQEQPVNDEKEQEQPEDGEQSNQETEGLENEEQEQQVNDEKEQEQEQEQPEDGEQSIQETEGLENEEDSGDDNEEENKAPATEEDEEVNKAPIEEQDDENSAEESTEVPTVENEESIETPIVGEEIENNENEAPIEDTPEESENDENENESPVSGASDSQENAPVKAKKKCVVRKHN